MTCPREALVVSSSGAPAETVTCSVKAADPQAEIDPEPIADPHLDLRSDVRFGMNTLSDFDK